MVDIALLGTGGMMPLPNRFLSSMLCRLNGRMFLVDCGEGTQVSLKLLGWGFKQIDAIIITHFHGDHISGLPGMLLAIGNSEREEDLHIIGPAGITHVVNSLRVIVPDLPFKIKFTELSASNEEREPLALTQDFTLRALPVRHRGACYAYTFELSRRGRFDPERARANNIPLAVWSPLQKNPEASITYEGVEYFSDMVLGPPRKGLKIGYCTDTRPTADLPDFLRDADLLICEGLYGEPDKQDKCAAHKHMSFREAAQIAKAAAAKELWLTHFSPAMPEPHRFLKHAADIFPNTVTGRDRMAKTLIFEEE